MNLFNELLEGKTTGSDYKDGIIIGLMLAKANVKELKECLKMFGFKGYSKLKKSELIEAILEEMEKWEEKINEECKEDAKSDSNIDLDELKEEIKDKIENGYNQPKVEGYAEEVLKLVSIVDSEVLEIPELIGLRLSDLFWHIQVRVTLEPNNKNVVKLYECLKEEFTMIAIIEYYRTLGAEYEDVVYHLVELLEAMRMTFGDRKKEEMVKIGDGR